MQRPSQPRSRRLWLVLSIVALVLLSYVGTHVFATHTSTPATTTPVAQQTPTPTQPPTSTPTPTEQATVPAQLPTQASTPTPTPVPLLRAAILGGTILAFSAKYGPPDSDSSAAPDSNSAGQYGYLHHTYDVVTQGAQVVSIVAYAPDDTTWSLKEAQSTCLAFVPPDSVYKQTVRFFDSQKNPTALHMVYYSAFLSKQLPASDFKDQNGNPAPPGTFDIIFTYDAGDTSQIVSCTV